MSSTFYGNLALALSVLFSTQASAQGDVAEGEKVFRKCMACHTVEENGPSRVGPNLHGVVGRTTATMENYAYSDAMKKMGEEGHVWTAEELDTYLENPREAVPGTKMAFVGLKKPEDRANVIAYLQSLSPEAASTSPPADAAADATTDAATDTATDGETAPAN